MKFQDLYGRASHAFACGEYLHLEGSTGIVIVKPLAGEAVQLLSLEGEDENVIVNEKSYEASKFSAWSVREGHCEKIKWKGALHVESL